MIDISVLLENKESIEELANKLNHDDIAFLVSLLGEKDDRIRYAAFLLMQKRSENFSDVYPYWKDFLNKLADENSYQRSIGIILIAENVKWDKDKLFGASFNTFMSHCTDDKFITSRQTIQSIPKWAKYDPENLNDAVSILTSIDVSKFKESQQKLILIDILNALIAIQEIQPSDIITQYLSKAITGSILDKKSIKQFQNLLQKIYCKEV